MPQYPELQRLKGSRKIVSNEECEDCFHPVSRHGAEGCECDRTINRYGFDEDVPCGCQTTTFEPYVPSKEDLRADDRLLDHLAEMEERT